ncbi:COG1361 S-layer family protein [Halorubrum sp. DTA46]|uniref:COG1361 S-layer family protein n=1 Tax=Halorubrum sp. DTA46 TaxID=3402162 RepID=UPI003AAE6D79
MRSTRTPSAVAVVAVVVAVLTVAILSAVGGIAVAQGNTAQQTAAPQAGGEPDLDVHAPNPTLTPGQTNEVTLQISNDGELDYGSPELREAVTTARNVRVEADADGTPLTVESGETAIGSVTEDRPGEVPIAVSVPDDIEEGSYTVDVRVRYSHTYRTGSVVQERSRSTTVSVDLEVDSDARFEVVNATTDARIGDTGTLEVEIENVGAESARDANVILESQSAGLGFGESASDAARIGEIEAGETATVRYDVGFAPDAPVREYALDASVAFRTPEGLQRLDETPTLGVTPAERQRFSVADVESDLYVGEEGEVRGTVTNDGPVTAQNVVIRYAEESPNVIPIETAVAVGTLEAGESADFRLPIEISGEAEAVDRTADIAVQYRNADSELRLYEDVELLFDVSPKRDQFVLDVQQREITAGESITLDVEVTNNLDEPVTDVEARLFTDSPLDSDDDEAYVEALAPGESTTMTFTLDAESSATAKTYPVSVDFRYDDARGNSQLSDTTRVPITVVDGEGGVPWLVIVGALVLIVVAGGAVYYTRAT